MTKSDLFYGMDCEERLVHQSPEDVVEQLLDDSVGRVGEPVEETADRMTWPIRVVEYRRMELPKPEHLTCNSLKWLLDRLDEEYGDPDGDATEPTEVMRAAERAFHAVVLAEYVPWMCEPSGTVIEYTRERAVALMKGAER